MDYRGVMKSPEDTWVEMWRDFVSSASPEFSDDPVIEVFGDEPIITSYIEGDEHPWKYRPACWGYSDVAWRWDGTKWVDMNVDVPRHALNDTYEHFYNDHNPDNTHMR
jgi:hypothetical protein